MSNEELVLSPGEKVLYDLFADGRDVAISELYKVVRLSPAVPGLSIRKQQQAVGGRLWRLNMKLAQQGLVVKPGQIKQTYRLLPLRTSRS